MSDASHPTSQLGRLEVSSRNPRYFTVADGHPDAGRAVYLTGAHVNNNFHDGLGFEAEGASTGRIRLRRPQILEAHGHNFVRLWRWEQFLGPLPHADVHAEHRASHGYALAPGWPKTASLVLI